MAQVLPQQRISIFKKGKEWGKECLDYYEQMAFTSFRGKRNTNVRKLVNYDLFNGKFNIKDLEYVCEPLGANKGREFPATLQHYDIISPALMLLIGEESKRPDVHIVVSEGDEAINRKTKELSNKIFASLAEKLLAEIDPSTIDPNNPPPTPEEILKYEKYNPSDLIESKANKLLKVLKRKPNVNSKILFNKGWKDVLISGEEIYWTGLTNGEPVARRVNPPDITIILDADSDFVDDAVAAIEVRLLTVPTILEEYGDILSANQIKELEEFAQTYNSKNSIATNGNPNFILNEGQVTDSGENNQNESSFGNIRVVRVEWISMKKVGILTFTDEEGIPQTEDIDEHFKLAEFKAIYPDAEVEWYWINEAWEGTKIGDNMYLDIKAKPNQRRRLDNPQYTRLGYTGLIYNATNSVSVSLIDRLKPYQYLYNILMYRLELAFASDQGKIMLMDLAQIPRSEGIDTDQWLYYLKAMKIAFVNSFEESQKGSRIGQVSNFNQFQSIDLSLANTIQQYISSLEFIKQQVAFLSGISPQRLGAIDNRESVGGVERSINQSALITEYWFDMHNEVKRRTYQALLEVAKIAYKRGMAVQYILDDMGIETLSIEEGEFEDTEFAVFVSNSTKDQQAINEVKQLFNTGLQQDKVNLSDIVNILQTDSLTDIKHALQRKEKEFFERQAEQAQQQNEVAMQEQQGQQQIEAAKLELEREKLDREDINKELDRQNKIELETVKALGMIGAGSKNPDLNQNMIPDVLEQQKLALEHTKAAYDQATKETEIKHKKEAEDNKVKLEEKKIEAQKETEKLKIKQTEIQNRNQEKMQKEELKQRERERISKEKIERLKARSKKNTKK